MKTVHAELPNGYKVKVIEKSKTIIDEIWKEKIYERDFIIEKDMNVMDIGANQGFFSLYAAAKGAKVVCVEPEKNNFEILTENINLNSLHKKIKPFQYAVSTNKGKIKLFFPDFDEEHASGMATTTKDFLKTAERLNFQKINCQEVDCINLKELFDLCNFNHIDLLKIDCEGAELDILKSAPVDFFKKINNIVMEIHDTYQEKVLYHYIKDLGFNIVTYKKLSGFLKTGYLFAENIMITKKKINETPVSILHVPSYYEIGKKLRLDGSKSFSSVNEENKLHYSWKINGKKIRPDDPVITHAFEHTGFNNIELEITDSNQKKDLIQHTIFIIKRNYFKSDNHELYIDKKHKTILENKQNFTINIQKLWFPKQIIIAVDYLEQSNKTAILEFNNEKTELLEDKNDYILHNIPSDLQINFSLYVTEKENLEINCWAMNNGTFRRSMIAWMKKINSSKK